MDRTKKDCTVRAPFDGRVVGLNISEGAFARTAIDVLTYETQEMKTGDEEPCRAVQQSPFATGITLAGLVGLLSDKCFPLRGA